MNLYIFSVLLFGISLLPGCREDSDEPNTARPVRDGSGFDKEGYDATGFNKEGRDRQGFNKEGCDSEDKDRFGYLCADIKQLKENDVTWKKHEEIVKELSEERRQLSSLQTTAEANEKALEQQIKDVETERDGFQNDLNDTKQLLDDKKAEIERMKNELKDQKDLVENKDIGLGDAAKRLTELGTSIRTKEDELAKAERDYQQELERVLKSYKDQEALTKLAEQERQKSEKVAEKLKKNAQKEREKAINTEKELNEHIAQTIAALKKINESLALNKLNEEINAKNMAQSLETIGEALSTQAEVERKAAQFEYQKQEATVQHLKNEQQTLAELSEQERKQSASDIERLTKDYQSANERANDAEKKLALVIESVKKINAASAPERKIAGEIDADNMVQSLDTLWANKVALEGKKANVPPTPSFSPAFKATRKRTGAVPPIDATEPKS